MGFSIQGLSFLLCFWIMQRAFGLDTTLVSPCPKAFMYRFQDIRKNMWYGSLFITSDSDAFVIQSIRILLDNEAESLVLYDHKNPNVVVDTLDNTEYLVEGLDVKVRKTSTFSMTIALKYKQGTLPKLTAYRVNEITFCAFTSQRGPGTSTTTTSAPPPPAQSVNHNPWTSWNIPQGSKPTPMAEDTCGVASQVFTPLIVGGVSSVRGQWPWHGALFAQERLGPQYRCGASLVSRRHAITAAHCVCIDTRSEEAVEPSHLVLVFGRSQLFDWGDPDSQSIKAKKILVHPGYNSSNLRNDIAIIRLEYAVKITQDVRPVCLWPATENSDINLLATRKGTVVGWGFTNEGKISEVLQHAEIPIIAPLECFNKDPHFYGKHLSPTSFCAGSIPGPGSKTMQACNGDSGGGLVIRRPGTDVWDLRGIVSLGSLDRDANMCDVKKYMVFTDVAHYLPWIEQCMRVDN